MPPSEPTAPAVASPEPRDGNVSSATRLARSAGIVGSATLTSRLLGLVRDQTLAFLFGAGNAMDAFNVAYRIPNLMRDLFAEGVMSSAFVPTFTRRLTQQGRASAWQLGNQLINALVVVTGLLVLAGIVFARPLTEVIAGDYADVPGKLELTVTLTRVLLPFLTLVAVAAALMGMLNSLNRFFTPALSPAMFNVASISVGSALYVGGVDGRRVAIGWSIGTVLGGMCQLGIQLPSLWRVGFRPRPRTDLRLRDPGVRRVGRLMLPAVGGLAAVQINIFVNTMFATSEAGAVSWLNYAFRFLQLPIGVFGVAIATVTTTRFASAAAEADREAMGRQLIESLRLVAFLTVPATVGLLLLGEPITRLIFERGKFTAADTYFTTAALQYYVIGLVAYASVKVLAPAFYALDQARIPVIASIAAVAGNLILNITLHPHYGYRVLALGTAVAAILNFTILYVGFTRRIARIDHRHLVAHLARVGAAATVMGAAVWGCDQALGEYLGSASFTARLIGGLLPVAVGALIYVLACRALAIDELGHFTRRLRRR